VFAPSRAEEREQFYAGLKPLHLGALWNVYKSALTREPARREVPFLWAWETVRPQLLRAGDLVTTAEAERRVLMFINPASSTGLSATATLYAALQLILPGESARAHRHSQAALRFVVEGEGAFTSVSGEKIRMSPGDLVLTPSMVWHDHHNEVQTPVIWLDGLDIPLIQSLNCGFFEEFGEEAQSIAAPTGRSEKTFGCALFPATASPTHSPVLVYRWSRAREALSLLAQEGPIDPFEGVVLRYANPANGGEVLATLGCRLQWIPRSMRTRARRRTTSAVLHVAKGNGYSLVDGVRLDWKKGDTMAVPAWSWTQHCAPEEEAVLFSFTDEPVLRALQLFREEAGA
jgi:gentisate 1,2-dioxygenase